MRVFNKIIFLLVLIIPNLVQAEVYDQDPSFGDYEPRLGYAAVVAYPQSRIFVKMQTTADGKTYLLSNSMAKPYNIYLHRLDMDPFFDQTFGVRKGFVAIDSNGNINKAQDMGQSQDGNFYISGISSTADNTNHSFFVSCINSEGVLCSEFNNGKMATYPLGILSGGKAAPMQTQMIVLANTIFVATFYLNDVNQTNVGIYAINKNGTVDQSFGNQGWFIIKYNRLVQNLGELIYHNGHMYLVGEANDAHKKDNDVIIIHMEHDLAKNQLKLFQNDNTDGFGNIDKGEDKFIAAQMAADHNLLVAYSSLDATKAEIKLYLGKFDANTLASTNWFVDGKYSIVIPNHPVPSMAITEKGSYLFAFNQQDKHSLFLMDSNGVSDSSFGNSDGLKLLPNYFRIGISAISSYGKYIYVIGEHVLDIAVQRYVRQEDTIKQEETDSPQTKVENEKQEEFIDNTAGQNGDTFTKDPGPINPPPGSGDTNAVNQNSPGESASCQLIKVSQNNKTPFIAMIGFILILFVYRLKLSCYNLNK